MAVSKIGLRIIKNAVRIRLAAGEELEDIIASYPKLSAAQADEIRREFGEN